MSDNPRQSTDLITFDASKIDLIKRMIAKDATNDELELFLHQCRRTGLDPMAKQIYFQKRAGKPVIITGIDGYRLIADRTGLYAGNDDPTFDNEESPARATVSIYKMISFQRCAFTATARWHQYYPGDGPVGSMWRKMPHLMLGKCAEALALRKAFPAELSGLYTKEEMDQAGKDEWARQEASQQEAPKPANAVDAATAAALAPPPQRRATIFDVNDVMMTKKVGNILRDQKVDDKYWDEIGIRLHGKPSTELFKVIAEVTSHP